MHLAKSNQNIDMKQQQQKFPDSVIL